MTTKIEKLLAPHSFKIEFVECLANIEKKYGFELFQISGIGKQLDINWFAKQWFGKKTNTADVSVDANSNVGLKNVVIWDNELSKPLKLMYSYYRMWKGMKKKYGLDYANQAVTKQLTGEIYINDFHGFASNLFYSYYERTVITIKYRGQVLSISLKELFDMFSDSVTIYPDRETVDLTNVNIYVLDKGNKFVKLTHVLRHKPHNDLLKFETKNGMTTIVTEDHPVILEDGSEKQACDIVKGDKLMISDCYYNIFDSNSHEIDRTKYIIGFAIGDGCLLTGGESREMSQISITQKDLSSHKVYEYICEESPNTSNVIHPTGNKNGVEQVTFGNKCFVCKNAQINKGAQNKVLPRDILNWNKNEILSLIAGLIDSDGSVNLTNGVVDIRITGFSAVQQVAEILRYLKFDRVRTSLVAQQKREGSFGSNYDLFRVSFVVNDEDLINFSDKLTIHRDIVMRERGLDGRFDTNEVLKIVSLSQNRPEYVYDITTETGHFHCQGMIQHNCYNYCTLDTANNGIPKGIDTECSRPTKYLNTFFEHLQLFTVHAGSSSLGATGLADLLLTVSAYVKRILTVKGDQHVNFATEEDCWTYVKEKLTNFIYFLNQPNRIVQSLFSNVSIYDDFFLDTLVEHYFIEADGTYYFAEKDIVKKVQQIFIETFNDVLEQRLCTFPVVTACFSLDNERNVQDEEFLRWVLKADKKFRFINLYGGATSTLSSCCFDKNQKVLAKSSNYGVFFDTFENIYNMKPYDDYKKNFTIFHNGSWVKGNLIKVPVKSKGMFEITTANNKKFVVTEDHINVTLKGDKSTSELTTDDYIAFNNRKLDSYPEKDLHLTYEQGFLIGLYLGDGSKYKRKDLESYEITFSLNETNKIDLPTLKTALEQWNIDKELHIHWQHNTMLVKIYSKELYNIISSFVKGSYAYEKELDMNILLQSVDFRKGITLGWYASDGGNSLRIYTISAKLAEQGEAIFTSLGINTVLNVVDNTGENVGEIRGQLFNRNYPLYCLRWYDMKNKRSMGDVYKVVNNTEYFKIKEIRQVEYDSDSVYCFEMHNTEEPYFTLPNGVITHNCRLRSDKTAKYMTNSIGSGSVKIGSLGVCSQNLPRLAFMSNGNLDEFKNHLADNIRLSQRINGIKRGIIKKAVSENMIPLYNLGYVDLKTQYQTTGVVGIYEALEILGYDIKSDEGIKVAEDILQFISDITDEMADEMKAPCNVEQIPAENVAVKLAKKDKMLGFNNAYEIYSNQYVPLKADADMFTRIKLVAKLDKYMSGGSILHININEEVADEETFVELTKTMYKMGVVYFAFNKLLAICNDCGKTFTTDKETFDNNSVVCPECESHNTECALRIVGFIRKFSSWSSERQAEGRQRKFYSSLVKAVR